jgi:hypothetical protein
VGLIKIENGDGEQTTESVPQLRSTVKNSSSESELLAVVEQGEKVQGTREKDSLDCPEEDAGDYESRKVVHRGHDGGDGSPKSHTDADIETRPLNSTRDHVGGDLEEDCASNCQLRTRGIWGKERLSAWRNLL